MSSCSLGGLQQLPKAPKARIRERGPPPRTNKEGLERKKKENILLNVHRGSIVLGKGGAVVVWAAVVLAAVGRVTPQSHCFRSLQK